MNARTIRRAIERKAQKEARKAQKQAPEAHNEAYEGVLNQVPQEAAKNTNMRTDSSVDRSSLQTSTDERLAAARARVSHLQLLANRSNAALSTGPVTPESKAHSSRNALKTGLTGRTVLLPSDDAALYERHVQGFFEELNPAGDRESELVQSIADSKWRLARIPSLEFGIYALGRIEFAAEFQNRPKPEAAALIEAKTYMAYQRQFNNLSIQESRLRRQCEKDTAELARLQQLRAAAEQTARKTALAKPAIKQNGFEFETANLTSLEHHPGLDSDLHSDLLELPQARIDSVSAAANV